MPRLVLGPLLRYVGDTEATIWVETDSACEVEVLGCRGETFGVHGHHYAIVRVDGLTPGELHEYEVALDGERAWPPQDYDMPPPAIHARTGEGDVHVAFGSCRVSLPHQPPYTLRKDDDSRGREFDALWALGRKMLHTPREDWPNLLLLLGDQVYADEISPGAEAFINHRPPEERGDCPVDEVCDFEEYTRLYWDSWSEPVLRWMLSNVPSAMIFDDHDVHDDWNTSQAWLDEMRKVPWWDERIIGAFMSYWVYQHIGNLTPEELDRDDVYAQVKGSDDAERFLREFAHHADRTREGTRWSYYRDISGVRLVVMDSRAGRILDEGRRCMVDDDEWKWIEEYATGGFDHLLLGTSLPYLLAPGMQYLEAWNEAVCNGAWGTVAARLGERLRQGLDLEHWAAFSESFDKLTGLIRSVAQGDRGDPPASIVALSGDVHHAYLADVAFPRGTPIRSAVYQATCSPFRNPLDSRERRVVKACVSRAAHGVARLAARAAGVTDPPIRWRFCDGPVFNNQIATLELEGRRACMRLWKTTPEGDGAKLEQVFERRLA